MSFARNFRMRGGTFQDSRSFHDNNRYGFNKSGFNNSSYNNDNRNRSWSWNWDENSARHAYHSRDFSRQYRDHVNGYQYAQYDSAPSFKRRKFSNATWGDERRHCLPPNTHHSAAAEISNNVVMPAMRSNAETSTSGSCKRNRSKLEDDEPVFMSRDEIDRYSPSRRDGIDALRETQLRYSYCAFIQNLGLRLDLPQNTTGTAIVLCHRFFVRRSHACHDRFLIATAALFLAAKSEETTRPLNDVVRASCEILHKQDISVLSYLLPVDWFEQYRERVTEAEHMILTTLNFELSVQHPYAPLTNTLHKLGLSQSVLVNLALNLLSEGLRSSLWLQFKPHHIAAGAAYLAAKFLNFDLASYRNIWQEFETTPAILQDVTQQLMELF